MPLQSAQRLTASKERSQSLIGEGFIVDGKCSTPYGIKGTIALGECLVPQLLVGAQRLTASKERSLSIEVEV